MQLIIENRRFEMEKIHLLFFFFFSFPAKSVWQRTLLTGVDTSIYLFMVTLYGFAEHYQRWYLFICVESEIGTTVKHKLYGTAAVSGCFSHL